MKQSPRIDQIDFAPEIGKYYWVPAIQWSWGCIYGRRKMWWPVIGPKHNDVEFFGFQNQHYHVDVRFLSRRHLPHLKWSGDPIASALSSPLNSYTMPDGPEPPTWRKMRCTLNEVFYPFSDREPIIKINEHFRGQQCARSKSGWICPHRHVPLGSMAIVDGVVTCPLHGLRIDAETGLVLGSESK